MADVVLNQRGFVRLAPESVTLEQSIESRPVHARESRSAGHVAGSSGDQPCHVILLELREYLLLGKMVRVVQEHDRRCHGIAPIATDWLVVENDLVWLDAGTRGGENDSMLDDILQFTHVAAPGTGL